MEVLWRDKVFNICQAEGDISIVSSKTMKTRTKLNNERRKHKLHKIDEHYHTSFGILMTF